MKETIIQLIQGILPVVITVVIIPLAKKGYNYLEKIIEAKVDSNILNKAKEVWNIVEEEFRLKDKIEDIAETKYKRFCELLKNKFPTLTDEDIYNLNKAIAGAVNANKEKKLSTDDYINKIKQLENENAELKKNADSVLKEKITNVLNNAEV